jgi:phosphopantothenoylcysteine decarboxylase/phosphopantothenate--cysteine ligase
MELDGKKIVLGLTGGIACYKAAELTRALVKAGASVQVAMTQAATQFITPVTMQAVSGKPVFFDQWDARIPNNMAHIDLTRDADAIVIAPCSTDFMFKLAHGACDDLLSTLCIARPASVPLLVAPAMNVEMWQNPATRRNAAQLEADGIAVLGPAAGEQACGEVGMGRMLEPADILREAEAFFQPKALTGKQVLITAGPTEEPIDPVRMITNASSGKMGFAVARACRDAGAEVTLVSGPVALATPPGVARTDVRTAAEMFEAVKSAVPACDVFFSIAAVSDYRVANRAAQKIKKNGGKGMTLDLVENPDILAWVAGRKNAPFCVGFAAESENLGAHAKEKRARKGVPLLAANLAQEALGADDNSLTLFDDRGEHPLGNGPKLELARKLVAHVAGMLATARR